MGEADGSNAATPCAAASIGGCRGSEMTTNIIKHDPLVNYYYQREQALWAEVWPEHAEHFAAGNHWLGDVRITTNGLGDLGKDGFYSIIPITLILLSIPDATQQDFVTRIEICGGQVNGESLREEVADLQLMAKNFRTEYERGEQSTSTYMIALTPAEKMFVSDGLRCKCGHLHIFHNSHCFNFCMIAGCNCAD
ncbi:MAG: hypothetical protein E4H01_12455 [Lysobacterales bacterium]|nr:MAG: hypothetical protein E4H01_12455 [Xanthomonadales bacterium]